MNVWIDGLVDVWIDGWVDGWIVGLVDGWIDGWVDGEDSVKKTKVNVLKASVTSLLYTLSRIIQLSRVASVFVRVACAPFHALGA